MPTYVFNCKKCNKSLEKSFKIEYVKDNDATLLCEKCGQWMLRDYNAEFGTHNVFVEKDKLQPLLIGPHAEEWKKKRAAKIEEEIYNEGFQSKNEMMDAEAMSKEEEVKRNKTKGSLSSGVQTTGTKEEKEKVKIRDNKKKQESKQARKRLNLPH